MNLSLTPQLEQYVRNCVGTGDYNNASEVVREAIRLFKKNDEENALKLSALKSLIAQGDDDLASGQSNVFNSETELDEFFEKL